MAGPDAPRGTSLFSRLLLLAGVVLALLVLGEMAARWLGPAEVLGPSFSEHDSLYGRRLKPNFTARRTTPETSFVLRTNSLGFRDPEPRGPIEGAALFLGDSNTLGYGVEDDEAFPALVRARLDEAGHDVPVVNAALPQVGNGWWLPFLERRAPRFAPRAVVLQVSPDDFGDNRAERRYSLEAGILVPHAAPTPPLRQRVWAAIDDVPGLGYSHLVSAVRLRYARRDTMDPTEAEARAAGHPLTRAILAEAIDRARASGWPTLVLLVGLEDERRDAAVEVMDAWGVPWIRVPSQTEAPELYFEDGHLNAAGHRLAAERVWGGLGMVLEDPAPAGSTKDS